jgi:streptogramin lyase
MRAPDATADTGTSACGCCGVTSAPSLDRLDPKTAKIDVYTPPAGMQPTGGATTVDYDGKGNIWSSAPERALRFDPKSERFTEYKSLTYKTPNGNGVTYGAAGDRNGNGWWAEMIIDTIDKGDGATGNHRDQTAARESGTRSAQRGAAQGV